MISPRIWHKIETRASLWRGVCWNTICEPRVQIEV